MAEYKLPTSANCDVLIHLVRECGLTLGACIEVARVNESTEKAKHLLIQECPICCDKFTRNEVSMLYLSLLLLLTTLQKLFYLSI